MDSNVSWDDYNKRWDQIWGDKLPQGQRFDLGGPTPALAAALQAGTVDVKGKRVFVPGCGRGYDVVEMARQGATPALGIDISEAGVEAALAYRSSCNLPPEIEANAQVRTGDFFKGQEGPFDVGYDYTFLCALHPDMRQAWAQAWGRLLSPGGLLVTQLFPLEPPGREGPPWPLQPELYDKLLPPQGFEKIESKPIPEDLSAGSRKGREMWICWRKL